MICEQHASNNTDTGVSGYLLKFYLRKRCY